MTDLRIDIDTTGCMYKLLSQMFNVLPLRSLYLGRLKSFNRFVAVLPYPVTLTSVTLYDTDYVSVPNMRSIGKLPSLSSFALHVCNDAVDPYFDLLSDRVVDGESKLDDDDYDYDASSDISDRTPRKHLTSFPFLTSLDLTDSMVSNEAHRHF